MERRVLLAVFLSFIVLYIYQSVFAPPPPPVQTAESPAGATAPSRAPAAEPQPLVQTPQAPQVPTAETVLSAEAAQEFVVETNTIRAVFTNRGGRVTQWVLKNYGGKDAEPINLVPVDLPEGEMLPFSLQGEDDAMTLTLNAALYRLDGVGATGTIDATRGPKTVVFQYQDAAGLDVRKEYRFQPDSYVVEFTPRVTLAGRPIKTAVEFGPGLGGTVPSGVGGGFFAGIGTQAPQAIFHDGEDVERVSASDIGETPAYQGNFRFAGIDDHYFTMAVVTPGASRFVYRTLELPASPDGFRPERTLVAGLLQTEESGEPLKIYFGPKAFDDLQAVDTEFVRVINFGIFAWLVVPLLGALKWIYGYVGNYGVSIVILTILINLVMFPLRHKSVVSMRKMQEVQPQLKAIQERYKHLKTTDPARQKMNTEIMNLYREKGANPASGCVPMLLTMPVLFAFYSLLGQAIELRGADFALWIHDLSEKDAYYVTPLLMGATMFWQQKITPSSADPAQQKIMLIMPVVFTFMFLSMPSGLVIYWFVSNLWAIGQQYFTNWMIGPPAVHVVRPAAERRVKNVGGGRTERAGKQT